MWLFELLFVLILTFSVIVIESVIFKYIRLNQIIGVKQRLLNGSGGQGSHL